MPAKCEKFASFRYPRSVGHSVDPRRLTGTVEPFPQAWVRRFVDKGYIVHKNRGEKRGQKLLICGRAQYYYNLSAVDSGGK